jgi:hypothetical protein
MATNRIVHARDIVKDIRSGMADTELMVKYGLSARALESAFTQLVQNGSLSIQEMQDRGLSEDDTVIIDESRSQPRYFPTKTIRIFDDSEGVPAGKLDNVNERGVGVSGMDARIGETKTLVLAVAGFMEGVEDIRFEAKCVWVGPNLEPELVASGHQITRISDDDMKNLRELIKVVASVD